METEQRGFGKRDLHVNTLRKLRWSIKRLLVNCGWFWERLDGEVDGEKVKKTGQNGDEIPE